MKMEEFNKIKAEVLNELNNAKISDLKRVIIENKIAEYEKSYRSVLTLANSKELKAHYITGLKYEAQIIKDDYFDFDILNELSIFGLCEYDNIFLAKWLSANRAFFFDDNGKINQNFNDLIAHIEEYNKNVELKKYSDPKYDIIKAMVGSYRNNKTTRQKNQTAEEAISDTIKLFKKCTFNLIFNGEPLPPKTRKLLEMMSDFTKNPTDYIHIKPKIKAEIDPIRKFLNGVFCYDHENKKQKLMKEDIKDFIDHFKIEDNYSKPK